MLRAYAVERRESSVEYVIHAVVAARFFNRGDVGRLFDDANEALVAGRAGAIQARIDVSNVVADGAEPQARLHFAHSVSQCVRVLIAGSKDVKGEPLRAFGAYAR